MLPFTREQFVEVFAAYNRDIWPAQPIAYAVALAMLVLLMRWPSRGTSRWVAAGLALMWAWTGVAYHGLYFSSINKAAPGFAALFVVQAALLLHSGVWRGRLRFGPVSGAGGWLGGGLIVYSAIAYPLLGLWAGHRYPGMPMFGVTPCPVTLFTFGSMLLTTARVPRVLLVIPLLWSLVGGSAAVLLGVPQDWPLLVSGLAIPVLLRRDRLARGSTQPA